MAPASGWPSPHSRFCTANASANTSRPQPFAWDKGVRKKPRVERGPNVIIPMRQPHRAMTAGVRHVIRCAKAGGMSMAVRFLCDGLVSFADVIESGRLAKMKRSDACDERHASMGRTCTGLSEAMLFGAGVLRRKLLYKICSK